MQLKKILSILVIAPFMLGFANSDYKSNLNNNYSRVSKNPKIISALRCMDGTTAKWAKDAILGKNLTNKPIQVQFMRLSKLNPSYANYDALGWMARGKNLKIYINKKHQSAPAEAIASLLSHEAMHQDLHNSLEEETYAWTYEADVWHQMKSRNQSLKKVSGRTYPLVNRLNVLEHKLVQGGYSSKYIRSLVYSNSGYRKLGKYSPGFDAKNIHNAIWKKPVIGAKAKPSVYN